MKTEVSIYIKKLISLFLVTFAGVFLYFNTNTLLFIPFLLLVHAFVYNRITGEKPPYLFTLPRIDAFINKKGGFWNFFKLLVNAIGLAYDIIIWVVWSVFLIFIVLIDLVSLIKDIIYWLIHALLWFLKLLVPPFIFLYKIFLYYLIGWPWSLYQMCYRNVRKGWYLNYLIIALWGSVIAVFAIVLFWALDLILDTQGLVYIGWVLALLPLAWSFGEIASIRKQGIVKKPYLDLADNFENGFEAAKHVLYYVLAFLVLAVVQTGLDFLGWIPNVGLSLLGLSVNINTFISMLLVVLFFILIFASWVIPTHLLYTEREENPWMEPVLLIKILLWKGLRYLFVHIPGAVFSLIVMALPAVLVVLALMITMETKDKVIEQKISTIQKEKVENISDIALYQNKKRIERLYMLKRYPLNILDQVNAFHAIPSQKGQIEQQTRTIKQQLADLKESRTKEINALNKQIQEIRIQEEDEQQASFKDSLQKQKELVNKRYKQKRKDFLFQINKLATDLQYLKNQRVQVPIALFFTVIWVSLFFGFVWAFYVSFMGNVYFRNYTFRENNQPSYWTRTVRDIRNKNSKQPLLGFTLLIILGIVMSVVMFFAA